MFCVFVFVCSRVCRVCVCLCVCTDRAALVAQFPVAQQALALLDVWVSLPLVQELQLLLVVLALRLAFTHVDVRQHLLDYGDLNTHTDKTQTQMDYY